MIITDRFVHMALFFSHNKDMDITYPFLTHLDDIVAEIALALPTYIVASFQVLYSKVLQVWDAPINYKLLCLLLMCIYKGLNMLYCRAHLCSHQADIYPTRLVALLPTHLLIVCLRAIKVPSLGT